MARWLWEKLREVFTADLRSLAVFRIAVGLLVIVDLFQRSRHLSAHYTDAGVLPRDVLLEEGLMSRWSFSLNLMSGEPYFQALLFGLAMAAAVGVLVGYRTRLMTFIVWVLLISIHWRDPLVLNSSAPLLRNLLFWGMFLPLGAVWSVDSMSRSGPARLSTRFVSLATVGLFLQIAFVYWFAALLKSGEEWREDGTAIYYALNFDQIVTPLGTYLLNFPTLLEAMTFGTLGLEAFGPFLLLFPFFNGPIRTLGVLAFASLHFGIHTTMDIGIFPFISAFCMVCFLPAWFWETVMPRAHGALADRLKDLGKIRLPSVTSRLAGILPAGGGLGNHSSDASGTPVMLRSSRTTNLLAAFFLTYIFCWNLTSVSSFEMPERLEPVGSFLGIGQYWGMFAPSPSKADGWYVIPGNLAGGQQVDLMPVTRDDYDMYGVSWEKPGRVADTFADEHWRKYFERIYETEHSEQRLYLARYICREWNGRHTGPEQLRTFDIVYMLEMTQPDYRPPTTERVVLWEHTCF